MVSGLLRFLHLSDLLSLGHALKSTVNWGNKALPGAWGGVPKIRALFEATYFAGLRKAGMPEE